MSEDIAAAPGRMFEAMAIDPRQHQLSRLAREAVLEHDRLLTAVLIQTYRELSCAYRATPQYAAMVHRHPELARALAQVAALEAEEEGGHSWSITLVP